MPSLPEPTADLLEWAPDVWIHEAWLRFLGFPLKSRMTVVRLGDGSLWLHSPIGDPDRLGPRLDALGEVRHLLAPNALHHLGLRRYREAWPGAAVYATSGVDSRSGQRVDHVLSAPPGVDPTPEAWRNDLELCVLSGNLLFEEALVWHRPSRTLIVTDFVEKIDTSCTSEWALRILPCFGLRRGVPTPAPEHRYFAVDPAPLAEARERVLGWDFDRMIIAHGPNVVVDAKSELATAFDAAIRAATGRSRLSIALRRAYLRVVPS